MLISCKQENSYTGRLKYISNEPFKIIVLENDGVQYQIISPKNIEIKDFIGDSVSIIAEIDSAKNNSNSYFIKKTLYLKHIQIIN